MNVLWLSWKDRWHPQAGGAETVSGEIMDRLVKDGHNVTLLTAAYPNATGQETKNGVKIVRDGNRFTVYGKARQTYRRQYRNWPDVIIDEMNTIPFGAGFINREKSVLLCYQLAREVWFYQMFPPVSWIGYMSEPVMLKAMAKRYPLVLTESNSSKKDLASYGFKNIHVFKVGMAQRPIARLSQKKYSNIVLSLGSIRPMKRTLDAVRAFEVAKDQNPELTMVLAGDNSGKYAQKVMDYIKKSRHTSSISVLGRVSNDERLKLMRKADIILVTSIKEGWGLIVTEANSQGTPAIGYDTDGLRDSIQNNKTGLLVPDGDFTTMGKQVVSLLSHHKKYEHLRTNSWKWSHEFSFNASYQDFLTIIESRLRKRTRN